MGTLDDEVRQAPCTMVGMEAGLAGAMAAGTVNLGERDFMVGNGA